MTNLWLALFAIGFGFTASGIVANLYRVLGLKVETRTEQILRTIILVIAGPCVVMEHAMQSLRAKRWTRLSFWAAVMGTAYWSLGIGLFILDFAFNA